MEAFTAGWGRGVVDMCESMEVEIIDIQPEIPFVAFMNRETNQVKCFGDQEVVEKFREFAMARFDMKQEEMRPMEE